MRTAHALILAVSLCFAQIASADLLWDNFAQPNPWDEVTGLSSERATLISETYVVDDVIFEVPVQVESIQWVGFRDNPDRFTGADYIILDGEFNVIADVRDQAFDAIELGEQFGLQVYEGTVLVQQLALDPGHYYVGARLVDGHLGRNFAATSYTGGENVRGETQAYFIGVPFGADNWTPVDQILQSGTPSDFAYRVNGTIIPEPAGLLLLGLGGVALLRRR